MFKFFILKILIIFPLQVTIGFDEPEVSFKTNVSDKAIEQIDNICLDYGSTEQKKTEIVSFMKDSYELAIDLCNKSNRVGCKYSDFMREVSSCINKKYFDVVDINDEFTDDKDNIDIPKPDLNKPLIAWISVKILNIHSVSTIDMDFVTDFYIVASWVVTGDFFTKFMTKLCIYKKIDMESKIKITLFKQDLKIFWVPDLYMPNAKAFEDINKKLKRPPYTDFLEITFKKFDNGEPYLKFIFISKRSFKFFCSMNFDDYPVDVQQCVIKIRSFYSYNDDLVLKWYKFIYPDLHLLEYSVNLSKNQDTDTDYFNSIKNAKFSLLLIHLNFTRKLSSKISGVFFPSFVLIMFNYFTYFFGVNTYSVRSSIGIMVLLTLVILFSKVRSELPSSSNISGMEIWLIFCFFCDLEQLIEASIVESVYTKHCIKIYMKKKREKKIEQKYFGVSYSWLFDDNYKKKNKKKEFFIKKFIKFLIIPSIDEKKPEYWSILIDKFFRIFVLLKFFIFYFCYQDFLV